MVTFGSEEVPAEEADGRRSLVKEFRKIWNSPSDQALELLFAGWHKKHGFMSRTGRTSGKLQDAYDGDKERFFATGIEQGRNADLCNLEQEQQHSEQDKPTYATWGGGGYGRS